MSVKPATATRMCDRLVPKVLIRRREERGDRRHVRLALSVSGRALVDAVTDHRRREIERIVSEIPAGEQVVLVQALGRFAAAAGEVPEQAWSTGWDL